MAVERSSNGLRAAPRFAAVPGWIWMAPGAALDLLWLWQCRLAERERLLALDDHMLKDLGLSRADAEGEGRKPFWRP